MLKDRVITALWGTFLFIFALLFPWGKGLLFFLFLLLISLLALKELFSALKTRGEAPLEFLTSLASFCLLLLAYLKMFSYILHLLFAFLLISFLFGLFFRRGIYLMRDISISLFALLYVSGLLSYLLLLSSSQARIRPPVPHIQPGTWICLIVVLINWLSDMGSYFGGLCCGKRHIFPRLSPGKTLEGFIVGFLASLVFGFLLGIWSGLGILSSFLLALTIAIFAPLGDLAESALKRELGIKDFSSILPGHGGILDRFDSLLFSSFVSYWLMRILGIIG